MAEKTYPVENFSNTLGGIRIHSWSFNGSYVNPGVALQATNALNTVSLSADGLYNINEDRYAYGARVAYGGLFPVLSLNVQTRERNTAVQTTERDSFRIFGQEFQQLLINPEVSVPLNWVAGNFRTQLLPSVGVNVFSISDEEEGQRPASFTGLSLGLGFASLQRQAVQQVQPRLGVTVNARYDGSLTDGVENGRLIARSAVYLPGVFPTHGIRLDFDLQAEQAENLYQYPDVFRYARGFTAPLADRVWRFGANYQLPLLYPEFGILGITYFRRIRLNAFLDVSRFTIDDFLNQELTLSENSVGGEFIFDNTWLNTQDLSVGVQIAYLLEPDPFSRSRDTVKLRLLLAGSF